MNDRKQGGHLVGHESDQDDVVEQCDQRSKRKHLG